MTRQIRDSLARKRRRQGSWNLLLLIGLISALVTAGFVGLTSLSPDEGRPIDDVFTGHIVNSQLVGSTEGTVQEDRDCQSRDGIIYTCTAVINQPSGTIYFHYTHNMHNQPCLAPGNSVSVTAQQDGTAVVTRLS